ncbi:MAG: sugar nucleotide-binding protein [archaeon]
MFSEKDAFQEIKKFSPNFVINCAGKTGRPNVDWCEDHKKETLDSNVFLPLNLAKACEKTGSNLVHIGSGCVYEGDNNGIGFSETDPPNFYGSFYSITKLLSEELLKEHNPLQLRIRMPIDTEMGPRNFITKISTYKKVINIQNSMTIIEDMLEATEILMKKKKTGIYNIVNPGTISHKEILQMYTQLINPNHKYETISLEELHSFTKAKRSNCVLNSKKIESEIKLPNIKTQIEKILKTNQNKKNQTP